MVIQDRSIINPAGGWDDVRYHQGWRLRKETLLGKEVHLNVHIIIGMGSGPGEFELPRVGVDSIKEGLEQGLVGCKLKGQVCHGNVEGWDCETHVSVRMQQEDGETMPPILLHGEEAAMS